MGIYTIEGNRKNVRVEQLPPEAWDIISGEFKESDIGKLYATVSWLYRCVAVRSTAVAGMPFELHRGGEVIATYDGLTYDEILPPNVAWMIDFPELLAKTEAASVLGGRAYWERRRNVLGTGDARFDWLIPSSITQLEFDEMTGDFLRGKRRLNRGGLRTIDADDLVWFWLPDYSVELGPAVNYPGRAVLNNAGVIGSMDLFLRGYFERGMVKATLLKYKEAISPDESQRVKDWWKRVFTGVKNAFASEVVRGDFEAMPIGEGIKDLGDHALTDKERESIASGLGVPQSKVAANAANFATKQSDDVMFIEDTIIPEVAWIFKTCNKQIFNPLGYHLVANPQTLRIMQSDEVERSQAFMNYVGSGEKPGLPVSAVVEMLGLTVPMPEEVEGATPQKADVEPTLLSGIQIQSALSIIEQYAGGKIGRPEAINMYQAFLGIDPSVGNKLIPLTVPGPTAARPGPEPFRAVTLMGIQDKREERDQFVRWLDKRGAQVDLSEFKTRYLDADEKASIFNDWLSDSEMSELLNQFADAMGAGDA